MSDAPETRRGATAPLPMTAQPTAAPARPVTQVSASAVPSTLESPRDAKPMDPSLRHDVTAQDDAARVAAERDAAFAAAGVPVGPVAMTTTAPLSHDAQESARRGAPATLMSPAVPVALASGDKPASPPLAPEEAVVDVGAPAHAFLPPGASPAYGGGAVGPGGRMHPGAHLPGGAHAGPGARRSMSTTVLVMLVVGGVAAIILLAAVVMGFFYVAERRKAEAAAAERALHPPAVPTAVVTQEAPRTPPRFGGTRARLAVTSGGAMDVEAVRASLAGVLPRIDACFAAAELEPPNHESAAYDLDVQPNGEVKKAEPATAVTRAPKLDACVVQSLRAARLPKAARASTVKLTFSDPLDVH